MSTGRILGLALRLAIIVVLLAGIWVYRGGFGDVRGALAAGGWVALAVVCAWHLLSLSLCGYAQRTLMPGGRAGTFLLGRWVHEAVGELAGFLPLSGEVATIRTLARRGVELSRAAAIGIVDLTAEAVGQFVFTVIGVIIWLSRHPAGEVGHWALIGLTVSVPLIAALLIVQRTAFVRFVETLPARLMPAQFTAPDEAQGTLAAIRDIYANRVRLSACGGLHLAAWLIATGEAGLALILLGHALPLGDVIAMEAFVTALRSAAFIVPAAIGVQEGAYVVIGLALGLPPDVALAVSLLKRGREVIFGLPGLVAWQAVEGRIGAKLPS